MIKSMILGNHPMMCTIMEDANFVRSDGSLLSVRLIISWAIDYVTCYKFDLSNQLKLQH